MQSNNTRVCARANTHNRENGSCLALLSAGVLIQKLENHFGITWPKLQYLLLLTAV